MRKISHGDYYMTVSIQNEKWHQSFDMKTGQPILQVTCQSENK